MTNFDPRTVHTHPHYVGQSAAPQFGTGQFPGQQFPGPVPPPSRPSRKLPLAAKIVAGFVAVGLVAGGAGTYLAFSGGTAEAAIQSTSFAGANPTTSPFGTDAPQVAAVAATGPQAGDTTGLFAATTPPACTTADFLSQLQADPNKLAAFGGVFGLGATDVPAFVNSLAPVVLRANTSVTDHPFSDGAFVEQPAILAAGTAVLVNSYGEPTVKCFNGNPLTGGAPSDTAVSVIPTEQVIANYQFTSIDNTRVVVIPGKPDPKPHPGHNPDPFLQAEADAAAQLAQNARTAATTARTDATTAAQNQKAAQANLDAADLAIQQLKAKAASINPLLDPVGFQQAQEALKQAAIARQNLAGILASTTKAAQDADTKAKGLEDKATADEQAAAQAKQEVEDFKNLHQNHDKNQQLVDAKKVDDPAATAGTTGQTAGTAGQTAGTAGQTAGTTGQTTGTQGQTTGTQGQTKQAPALTGIQECPQIVTDAATVPAGCKLPTGSADTATATGTTPATSGTATTSGEKTSTGSDSGTGKSSSSSSSTSGSKSSAKGGSDK